MNLDFAESDLNKAASQILVKTWLSKTIKTTTVYASTLWNARTCPEEIKYGADDGSEMGVFHRLNQKERIATLLKLLDEYTEAGLDAGVIHIS